MSQTKKEQSYDLEERTARFGESMIEFVKTLRHDIVTRPLIEQVVRSSTSIGANYMEANQASSRKDFTNKIYLCKKESNETKHWLRMIVKSQEEHAAACRKLWKEAQELVLIFSKITSSLKQ